MASGQIFDIKEFSIYDGPGLRTTVFLKGCPLRCLWCHNPEGLSTRRQIMVMNNNCGDCVDCLKPCKHPECIGLPRCLKICKDGKVILKNETVDAKKLARQLLTQSEFFGDSGITFSGGEPTSQSEFLFEMLDLLSEIHTVVETCGYTDQITFKKLIDKASLIYLDIKHTNSKIHKELTGVDNELILSNLNQLINSKKEFVVRMPLIYGYNDDEDNLNQLVKILSNIPNLKELHFLPYNPYTEVKYNMMDIDYSLKNKININTTPTIPEELLTENNIIYKIYTI